MKSFRVIALILAAALLIGLTACGKEEADPTGAGGESVPTGTGAHPTPVPEEPDPWAERDLLGVVESWRGQSGSGKVDLPGNWETTVVRSLQDLAPYRSFFPNLSDQDAARITSDKDGIAVVLEIASADLTLLYGTDTITQEDGVIVFQILSAPEQYEPEYDENGAEVERPDPGSPYEYFLFYIPAEAYGGEPLSFLVS